MPTPSASEARLERRIAELSRAMDRGFERVYDDLTEVKRDVKSLHREAIPHRVNYLEKWRDNLSGRLWTFLIGCGVASVSAWIAVIFRA